jgi:uncharacterized protein (TIGR01244 family)
MMRLVFAAIAGGLFGLGLLVSGMTDTVRVQGFLDVSGLWDPTLAFVMGGAIVPMVIAWRVAARHPRAWLGNTIPRPASRPVDIRLITGSALFGAGWAIAGLCPGPALASLSFGGNGGVIFLLAMVAGMMLVGQFARTRPAASSQMLSRSTGMEFRPLTPRYTVSPQIEPADLSAIKAAGYSMIIDNRPDGEIPGHLHGHVMQQAAEAMGFEFVINPIIGGAMTDANVAAQAAAMAKAKGPVFAYCASGNRCSVVWALTQAGTLPADDLVGIPAKYGYRLDHLRPQIAARAAAQS